MGLNIHKAISSNRSLCEQRSGLEEELRGNEDTRDSEWGILSRRGCIKQELSEIEEEMARRRDPLSW